MAAAWSIAAARPGAAQTVVGTVVEAETGLPLPATFVLLEDPGGEVRARALTGRTGGFRIQAPGAGTWRLRTERIGYEPALSRELTLQADEVRTFRFRVETRAIRLGDIRVDGHARCAGLSEREGLELQRVWDETRKVLSATVWTGQQPWFRFDAVLHSRRLDGEGREVEEPRLEEVRYYGRHPFRAIPTRDLVLGGFVQQRPGRIAFHAPDAEVLLSDLFVDRHCFRLERSAKAGPRELGLVFERRPGARVTDIEGVMWLDVATAELRRVEFRYSGPDLPGDPERLGGGVEFARLPAGEWIVRRWWIRTPVLSGRNGRVDEGGGEVWAVWRTARITGSVPVDTLDAGPPADLLVARFDLQGPAGVGS